jgi:DNA-binding beta-propeller fold protein YncE
VTNRFFVDSLPGDPGFPRFKPLNLLWSPAGDMLYVGLHAAGEVCAFDVDGNLIGSVKVGAGPAQMALTRDGLTLVVANRNDASLSIVDLPGLEERARVRLERSHPHGVALDSEGRTAFVSYEGATTGRGGVVAVDLAAERILWAVEAGGFTLGIAYVP